MVGDLKPENLLVTDTDAGPVLKIADFGLSALLFDTDASSLEAVATGGMIALFLF